MTYHFLIAANDVPLTVSPADVQANEITINLNQFQLHLNIPFPGGIIPRLHIHLVAIVNNISLSLFRITAVIIHLLVHN